MESRSDRRKQGLNSADGCGEDRASSAARSSPEIRPDSPVHAGPSTAGRLSAGRFPRNSISSRAVMTAIRVSDWPVVPTAATARPDLHPVSAARRKRRPAAPAVGFRRGPADQRPPGGWLVSFRATDADGRVHGQPTTQRPRIHEQKKIESFERINSIRETTGNLDSGQPESKCLDNRKFGLAVVGGGR